MLSFNEITAADLARCFFGALAGVGLLVAAGCSNGSESSDTDSTPTPDPEISSDEDPETSPPADDGELLVNPADPTDQNESPESTPQLVLLSANPNGSTALGASSRGSASRSGNIVVFQSNASDLVDGDTNGVDDIFILDRANTSLTRIQSSLGEPNGASGRPSVNAAGTVVVFESSASNLVPDDQNNTSDVFRYDIPSGTLDRVSVDTNGVEGNLESFSASVSESGQLIAFASNSNNLVTDDVNVATDIFVRDTQLNTTRRVSVNSAGEAPLDNFQPSADPMISGDGSIVVFSSYSSNLTDVDTGPFSNIYRHSLLTSVTTLVSMGTGGMAEGDSAVPSVTEDGRLIVYSSLAGNLVDNDTNELFDIFIFDTDQNTTRMVSQSSSGDNSNGHSRNPVIDGAGVKIAFQSLATNLVSTDSDNIQSIYLYSITDDQLSPLGSSQPDGSSYDPAMSVDGSALIFTSDATNLSVGDLNASSDIFLYSFD